MPKLNAVRTAVPPYCLDQASARDFARGLFGQNIPRIERLLPIFDNAGIHKRYFSKPIEWFGLDHDAEETNQIFIETATALGAKASRRVLNHCNIKPDEIDYLIYVNTTGLATPSIDARLINILDLRHNIRRTPVWGLGCAGGVAGLSHAYHYALGHPKERVLVVCVELCGLTFISDDYSKSNFVACALFGDGAAAAVLSGDQIEAEGLDIVGTQSTFYPDSLDVMGWNISSRGLQVVFDKRIPDIVNANADGELHGFLRRHEISKEQIKHYLYHPGGLKVVNAYETAYGVSGDAFKISRDVLRDFGNMSSVTVLFVMERFLQQHEGTKGSYGVVSALGPGFCSESLLVKN